MKLLTIKSPGQMYQQFMKCLQEAPTVPVVIQFDNCFINNHDALAYHDMLLMFKGQLDITVEVLYNMPMNMLSAICALPVEKRRCLPSVIVNFIRDTAYMEGTVTQVKITALQYQQVIGRLDALISTHTQIDIDEVKQLAQIDGYLAGDSLMEKGIFGGYVNV